MKIIAIACNYAAHNNLPGTPFFTSEEPVVFSRADSALLKDGKPFFIPDFAADCRCQAELVVRLSRLGKSIPERFAYRYYDAVTVGIGFTAGALLERCRREGLPWELATGFDGAAAVGRFAPLEGRDMADLRFLLEADGTEVQRGWSGNMRWSVDRLIAYVSRFYTVRQGDLLFTGTPVAAVPARIGTRLDGFLDGERRITIKVK